MKFFCLFFVLLFFACKTKIHQQKKDVNRGFYFWKSVFKPSAEEKFFLEKLQINTLYLKFFDIAWNSDMHAPFPIAQINLTDTNYLQKNKVNKIPTVFITNECILKIDSIQTRLLSKQILTLIKNIAYSAGIKTINEIQIDCDWTATTKAKYFSILNNLKELDTSIDYSATLRLHQIKFLQKTGVPPVKKGMLMCYNMGNLKNIASQNSILDNNELQKYIADLQHYPLPLDVALPLFDWKVLFRNNKFSGLIQNLPDTLLSAKIFTKNGNNFTSITDTNLAGYRIKKNDVLRNEKSDYEAIIKAATLVSEKISNKNITVSLFHLDTLILKKYSHYEIENIFNTMR